MQLGDVLDDLTLDVATGRLEISRVEIDSRRCEQGTLFFAMPGHATHGRRFAADAVQRGAVAVVAGEPLTLPVPVVLVPATQLRALLAHASATVVGHPEQRTELVGVTGTNGKTTVTTLVAEIARAVGWNGASIGTLTHERTTPPPPELWRTLAAIDAAHQPGRRSVVAMEVSSHALDQGRVDGICFDVAAFTNLGHDHLDYHHTMEEYFAAKAQLFTPERARHAVLWCDDPYGERLASTTTIARHCVSRADALDVVSSFDGTRFTWRSLPVRTALVGGYNVDNALVAMAVASALGMSDASIVAAMDEVNAIAGRFEVVHRGTVSVVVDYAHTPEGLARLLSDVRAIAGTGRLITVFGCGGERDREKRPAMGAAASTASDFTIVTSDNPRGEPPETIIDEIMAGVAPGADVRRVIERREAIEAALRAAAPGDVLVIAGKGHETTQVVGERVVPFDDRAVVREIVEELAC
jgi:UDP-N-acetylmuramoyl-L-alanyl-D-glutamate--2,6-diaminopimelate ligase